MIVALRALRNGARDDTREVVDRALAKLEAAAAQGRRVPQRRSTRATTPPTPTSRCWPASSRAPPTGVARSG